MKNNTWQSILLGLLMVSSSVFAAEKEIALTIDDLPFVGASRNSAYDLARKEERFMRMLDALNQQQVPAVGFVIAGAIAKGQWELLEAFQKGGYTLGNHTYSHLNLNTTSAQKYIDNVAKADKILTPLMTDTKYFRYPYLAEGKGEKEETVKAFLAENNYVIAPVTVDSKDYRFNNQLMRVYYKNRDNYTKTFKKTYLAYIWKQTERAEQKDVKTYGKPLPQILLIHANQLNSIVLNDIIEMYKNKGYKFVTLGEALKARSDAEVEKKDETVVQ
jgi:peptidoglycan/xylan/chitin deacetylase (PgdA/CDA1 family)